MSSLRARILSTVLLGATAASVVAASTPAFAQVTAKQQLDAKTRLAAGDKAAKSKDWATARTEYAGSMELHRTAAASEGLANAAYELKDTMAAYEAYKALLSEFGATMPKPKKDAAQKRLSELEDATGELVVTVSEADAVLEIDGKPAKLEAGKVSLRVSAGPHKVRASKAGFIANEQFPAVPGKGKTETTIKLEAESKVTRVTIKEKSGEPVRVLIDGVDVGPAPYTGDVEPGEREIALRSNTRGVSNKVTLTRGDTREITLESLVTAASLKLTIPDGKGIIYIDGKVVGEGQFGGEVPAGAHTIAVTREGYERFEEQVILKEREVLARTLTLTLVGTVTTGKVQEPVDQLVGMYGGFGLKGLIMPWGNNNDVEELCEAKPSTVGDCSSPAPNGGGLQGFLGYHWDPVGMELFLQGAVDQAQPQLARFQDPTNLGSNPPRAERFIFVRAGGTAAVRARVDFQTKSIRGGFAAGAGVSYRTLLMTREVVTADGYQSRYVPKPIDYFAPALVLDANIGYRLTKFTTLQLGIDAVLENPQVFSRAPATEPGKQEYLLKAGSAPIAVDTPPYTLSNKGQAIIGAYLGLMFGP
jgi:hypothetical protein